MELQPVFCTFTIDSFIMFDTPILFIVFNRPDTTNIVFNKIKEAKPSKLYITCDGPRLNNKEDAVNCERVRKIVDDIDWSCEVKRLYSNKNLGFSQRIKSALDWFFDNEEMGIILEDDCLPSASFFKYCELMLEKHKLNDEIQVITGSNFCDYPISKKRDYFVADFGYIWGWASWRRVVKNIKWYGDYSLKEIDDKLLSVYQNKGYANHFSSIIKTNYKVKDCWDVEFFIYNLMENKKNVFPNVNLISNIGNSGTHYNNSENRLLNSQVFEIDFKRFDVSNYALLSKSEFKMAIKQFNEKVHTVNFRDKLYLIKNRLKDKFNIH